MSPKTQSPCSIKEKQVSADEENSKENKSSEKDAEQEEEEEDASSLSNNKKKRVIFTYEDEVALLKGLAAYWEAHGRNNQWKKFHNFMEKKGVLSQPFKRTQVSEKMRRFKTNFVAKSGSNVDFPNDHDSLVFELSNILWGNTKTTRKDAADDDDDDVIKEQSPKKQKKQEDFDLQAEFPLFSAFINSLGFSEQVGSSCRKSLEKWEGECKHLISEDSQLPLDQMHLRIKPMALLKK